MHTYIPTHDKTYNTNSRLRQSCRNDSFSMPTNRVASPWSSDRMMIMTVMQPMTWTQTDIHSTNQLTRRTYMRVIVCMYVCMHICMYVCIYRYI